MANQRHPALSKRTTRRRAGFGRPVYRRASQPGGIQQQLIHRKHPAKFDGTTHPDRTRSKRNYFSIVESGSFLAASYVQQSGSWYRRYRNCCVSTVLWESPDIFRHGAARNQQRARSALCQRERESNEEDNAYGAIYAGVPIRNFQSTEPASLFRAEQ